MIATEVVVDCLVTSRNRRNREKSGEIGRNREKSGEIGRNREKSGEIGRNREKSGEIRRNSLLLVASTFVHSTRKGLTQPSAKDSLEVVKQSLVPYVE